LRLPIGALSVRTNSLKSMPPTSTPMGGIRISLTREETIFPKAAPMMTPTARSTTFPRMMKALNSLITDIGFIAYWHACLSPGAGLNRTRVAEFAGGGAGTQALDSDGQGKWNRIPRRL